MQINPRALENSESAHQPNQETAPRDGAHDCKANSQNGPPVSAGVFIWDLIATLGCKAMQEIAIRQDRAVL